MSALAGIWQWNGAPIDAADVATLAIHSRPAGCDGGATVRPTPSLVLQAHTLQFDRLSAAETQPYTFGPGSVATWDGRLDNRDDLLIALHRSIPSTPSDVAIVAAAYELWGLEVLPRLIGDWSLVLWDAPKRMLLLARDYIGNRPLFYRATPNRLVWATRLGAIAVCEGLLREPNELYIAAKLTGQEPGIDVTPFTDVQRLPAGHQFVATRYGDAPRRYWFFVPQSIRLCSEAAYADNLRAHLTEAVRVRLRADRTVWAHLSGGWDSSSIVCLAHRLITSGRVEAPSVQPISIVYPYAPESDESNYIAAVEEWCGLQTVRRVQLRTPDYIDDLGRLSPEENSGLKLIEAPIQDAGDRIVLSGALGDLVMGRSGTHAFALLEPLYAGHPLEFLRQVIMRSRSRRQPVLSTLSRLLYAAYIPRSVKRAREIRASRRTLAKRSAWLVPSWLASLPPPSPPSSPSVSEFPRVMRPLVETLYAVADRKHILSPDLDPPVWCTYPYTHRPLVEFVISVPQQAIWAPTQTRAGMARALATVLPPAVLRRNDKGTTNAASERLRPVREERLATTPGLPADVSEWLLVRRGYVEAKVLTETLTALRSGRRAGPALEICAPLEAWLQTLESYRGIAPDVDQGALVPILTAAEGVNTSTLKGRR